MKAMILWKVEMKEYWDENKLTENWGIQKYIGDKSRPWQVQNEMGKLNERRIKENNIMTMKSY